MGGARVTVSFRFRFRHTPAPSSPFSRLLLFRSPAVHSPTPRPQRDIKPHGQSHRPTTLRPSFSWVLHLVVVAWRTRGHLHWSRSSRTPLNTQHTSTPQRKPGATRLIIDCAPVHSGPPPFFRSKRTRSITTRGILHGSQFRQHHTLATTIPLQPHQAVHQPLFSSRQIHH